MEVKIIKLFRFKRASENIVEPSILQSDNIRDLIMESLSQNIQRQWRSVDLEWHDGVNEPKFDFLFIFGYIPVCNEKTYTILNKMKGALNLSFLPFTIESEKYYILSPNTVEKSVLNKRKSKIKYYSDKSIMIIDRYVFNHFTPTNWMFKIEESISSFFVTENFVNFVNQNKITGAAFEECKLLSNSLINKLFK